MRKTAERKQEVLCVDNLFSIIRAAKDDTLQRKPFIELALKELDWAPTVGIDDGLIKTIKYIENILNPNKPVFEKA